VRRFRDRIRKDPDHRVRRFETCLDCGSTVRVLPQGRRPIGGGGPLGPGYRGL
jgi:hypothetical protein